MSLLCTTVVSPWSRLPMLQRDSRCVGSGSVSIKVQYGRDVLPRLDSLFAIESRMRWVKGCEETMMRLNPTFGPCHVSVVIETCRPFLHGVRMLRCREHKCENVWWILAHLGCRLTSRKSYSNLYGSRPSTMKASRPEAANRAEKALARPIAACIYSTVMSAFFTSNLTACNHPRFSYIVRHRFWR